MASNLILPFAQGAGANVLSDAGWAASDVIAQGFQTGRAASVKFNKALRQSTAVASGFGQFVADYSAQDFSDALSPQTMRDNFRIAVAAAQAGAYYALDTSNVVNTVTLTLNPVPVSNTNYIAIEFKAANTNTGGVTIALNGFTTKLLVRRDGSALQANDIVAGRYYRMLYDVATSRYILSTPVPSEGIGNNNAIPIAQAAGSPFNFKTLQSPTRTNASAASAGQQITVLSGLTYVKKSTMSNVAITLGFFSYSPVTAGQGNGASTARLVTSTSVFTDFSLNNSLLVSGAPVGAGYNTPTIVLPGLPAGSVGLSLTYRRDDNASWNTIFNPNNSDFGGISNSPVSTLFIWEYEPGS